MSSTQLQNRSFHVIRELMEPDGWKTQDGRMTKKCDAIRETVHSRFYATSFRHFAILSVPAVLLHKLPITGTRKRQTATPANKMNS